MHIHFKEIDIEDFIWKNIPKRGWLSDRGLRIKPGIIYRQLNIPGAGVLDLVGISISKNKYTDGRVVKVISVEILELKRDAITCNNVGQIFRYINAIDDNEYLLLRHFGFDENEYMLNCTGVLVGHGIEKDALHILSRSNSVSCYKFDFDIETGIRFESVALCYPETEISAPEFSHTDIKKILKASYPIIKDNTPRLNEGQVGEGQSDAAESLPF